jgi:hypothetical protein
MGVVEERTWECGVIGSEREVLAWACGEDVDESEVVKVEVRQSNVQLEATMMTLKSSSHILASLKSKGFFWISCSWLVCALQRITYYAEYLTSFRNPQSKKWIE